MVETDLSMVFESWNKTVSCSFKVTPRRFSVGTIGMSHSYVILPSSTPADEYDLTSPDTNVYRGCYLCRQCLYFVL